MPTEKNDKGQSPSAITRALAEHASGSTAAFDRLIPLVYKELKTLAHGHLRRERDGHTLDTTALVHEAYLQLKARDEVAWQDRHHFFAVASRVMRHLLVDYARRRGAAKRARNAVQVTLESGLVSTADDTVGVLAVDEALSSLGAMDPRLERVVECRFFAGMSLSGTAEALGMGERTVERHWKRAKAYLLHALETEDG